MNVGAVLLTMLTPLLQPAPCLDPAGPAQATYLIVAADAFAGDCGALLAHRRADGLTVGLVRFSDVRQAFAAPSGPESLVAFLKHARADWGTRFVLLVGDAAGAPDRVIPFHTERAAYTDPRFPHSPDVAHDWAYATLGGAEPVLCVGRFPVQTAEELAVMIGKTIAYETQLPAGEWQARVRFLAGPFGGDPVIDRILEAQFTKMIAEGVPPAYDFEAAYASPASPYCPHPPLFHQNAMRMLNEGALLYCYVGHGDRTSLDEITWQGRTYPFLTASQVGEVAVANGLPVMAVIACWTAALDSPNSDCIDEALMKRPAGPVAMIGSTRICQPYGNALLGRALISTVFASQVATLGEAFGEALRRVVALDTSDSRKQLDMLAAMVQGAPALEPIRRDTVRHYLLLGDPALKLRRPETLPALTAVLEAEGVRVRVPIPAGRAVRVSLQTPVGTTARPVPTLPAPNAPGFAEAMMARYEAANNRTLAEASPNVPDGTLNVVLPLPADRPAGPVLARVLAWDEAQASAGAVPVAFPAVP